MGLSTHVLDTGLGKPAAGVAVALFRGSAGEWTPVGQGVTDADGRCRTLLGEQALEAAEYRLRFETEAYFMAQDLASLYPYVEITFAVKNPDQHHHIPLLLSANGYTTYRGS
jgi:5-hydroxyisourate hydrolase